MAVLDSIEKKDDSQTSVETGQGQESLNASQASAQTGHATEAGKGEQQEKSWEERYKDLEKKLSEQGQELGTLRKDKELSQRQIETLRATFFQDEQKGKSPVDAITDDEYWELLAKSPKEAHRKLFTALMTEHMDRQNAINEEVMTALEDKRADTAQYPDFAKREDDIARVIRKYPKLRKLDPGTMLDVAYRMAKGEVAGKEAVENYQHSSRAISEAANGTGAPVGTKGKTREQEAIQEILDAGGPSNKYLGI